MRSTPTKIEKDIIALQNSVDALFDDIDRLLSTLLDMERSRRQKKIKK